MIGLIDVDNKLPNLALMKVAAYYKDLGEVVEFVKTGDKHYYEKIYASAIFSRSRQKCEDLLDYYGDRIEIGGTGWDLKKRLPREIEESRADYTLYTAQMIAPRIRGIMKREHRIKKAQEIVTAGIGFTSRGCIRRCAFCVVPAKEGALRQDQEIATIINPQSNVLILHDNNFTADPECIPKLQEIKERGLRVDINQGVDIRVMTDEIAHALSQVNHLRSIHYAWDLLGHESQVIRGIHTLSRFIPTSKQMCYMLVGFDSCFEEDLYRYHRLQELGVRPYVMRYNEKPDPRLRHFARWVNSFTCKVCSFEEYEPWVKEQMAMDHMQLSLLPANSMIGL